MRIAANTVARTRISGGNVTCGLILVIIMERVMSVCLFQARIQDFGLGGEGVNLNIFQKIRSKQKINNKTLFY